MDTIRHLNMKFCTLNKMARLSIQSQLDSLSASATKIPRLLDDKRLPLSYVINSCPKLKSNHSTLIVKVLQAVGVIFKLTTQDTVELENGSFELL